jgi:uncharacterized zinc-type alcohol dehydrogenase-like protein
MTETAQQPARQAQKPKTFAAKAFAAQNTSGKMAPFSLERREPRPQDVQIEILYCGVCHSDLHQVKNEWVDFSPTVYPCVPGHEIVGRVVKAGSAVKKFKEDDFAAVGCMVDSDRVCENCSAGEEQYCIGGCTFTYNSPEPILGGVTYGGYSQGIVVDEAFALRVPNSANLPGTAPLLCAGITTYSPMRHWKVGKGQKVGVIGLGGLGHMGVKFAKAFGAHTVLFTTSASKVADGKRLGADEVVLTTDPAAIEKHAKSFNFILDTASAEHDIGGYLTLLKLDGTLTLVGVPPKPFPIAAIELIAGRHSLAGSGIGGIRETQEMLDFCADKGITADIEMIKIQQINEAYERLVKGDVKYRFVIDMASLK